MRQWIATIILPLLAVGCGIERQTVTVTMPPITVTIEMEYANNGDNAIEQR